MNNEIPSYSQMNKTDCGPAAVAFVTGQPLQTVKKLWGWHDYNDERDNLLDSPWHAFALLEKLKLQFQICNCSKIIQGKALPNKTVILIHNPSNPILQQHWCVLYGNDNENVFLHMGDGKVHSISKDKFQKLYSNGTPSCAYEVGIGNYKLSWYQRWYAWLTGKFI